MTTSCRLPRQMSDRALRGAAHLPQACPVAAGGADGAAAPWPRGTLRVDCLGDAVCVVPRWGGPPGGTATVMLVAGPFLSTFHAPNTLFSEAFGGLLFSVTETDCAVGELGRYGEQRPAGGHASSPSQRPDPDQSNAVHCPRRQGAGAPGRHSDASSRPAEPAGRTPSKQRSRSVQCRIPGFVPHSVRRSRELVRREAGALALG